MSSTGLREQIVRASAEQEIATLLATGKGYDMASDKTRRSWKRAANKKYGSFAAPAPIVQEETATKPRGKKKVKKVKSEVSE